MRVESALLCDSATVREGLLHVLGGGINELTYPDYPQVVELDFALRFVFEGDEVPGEHTFSVALVDSGGAVTDSLSAKVTPSSQAETPPAEAPITLALTLRAHLQDEGVYHVEFRVDDSTVSRIPLTARRGDPAFMVGGARPVPS